MTGWALRVTMNSRGGEGIESQFCDKASRFVEQSVCRRGHRQRRPWRPARVARCPPRPARLRSAAQSVADGPNRDRVLHPGRRPREPARDPRPQCRSPVVAGRARSARTASRPGWGCCRRPVAGARGAPQSRWWTWQVRCRSNAGCGATGWSGWRGAVRAGVQPCGGRTVWVALRLVWKFDGVVSIALQRAEAVVMCVAGSGYPGCRRSPW